MKEPKATRMPLLRLDDPETGLVLYPRLEQNPDGTYKPLDQELWGEVVRKSQAANMPKSPNKKNDDQK